MIRVFLLLCLLIVPVSAHDDGQYANSSLKTWFNGLHSQKGMCCSFADGVTIEDVDWDTQNGHYIVRIYGAWVPVPDDAVIAEPNKLGQTVVWPFKDENGITQIRCFMPNGGS